MKVLNWLRGFLPSLSVSRFVITLFRTLRLNFLCIGMLLLPQQLTHDVRVINVEVPVRVFNGDSFVDNLTMDDFEVFEDGILQKIEAVYLVKKASIQSRGERKSFTPETSRHFYLFFVVYEFNPKIPEAISFFINNVLQPEDRLVVVTPKTSYEMKNDLLAKVPKKQIADKLSGIIKKDIQAGAGAYRSVLRDIKRMAGGPVKSIEDQMAEGWDEGGATFGSVEEFLMQFKADMERLENLRTLDEQKLYDFATNLKDQKGQKYVYLFYQREFMPQIDKNRLALWEQSPILKPMLDDLFSLYKKTANIDMNRLTKTYADSSITFHFLYLTTQPQDIARDQAVERSWDVYETFATLAKATGGLATSSSNLAYLMDRASGASDNYYLLYYSPKDMTVDGKFREINVKVKTGGYRVTHLAGYFAR